MDETTHREAQHMKRANHSRKGTMRPKLHAKRSNRCWPLVFTTPQNRLQGN